MNTDRIIIRRNTHLWFRVSEIDREPHCESSTAPFCGSLA